jgi:hypothetical protein
MNILRTAKLALIMVWNAMPGSDATRVGEGIVT